MRVFVTFDSNYVCVFMLEVAEKKPTYQIQVFSVYSINDQSLFMSLGTRESTHTKHRFLVYIARVGILFMSLGKQRTFQTQVCLVDCMMTIVF